MITCPKCKEEHEPTHFHEEDEGEWECEYCGFKFLVEIEYEPIYWETCVEHEWGDWIQGNTMKYRQCKRCIVVETKG